MICFELLLLFFFFFSSRRRHTRCSRDWSSDVCSSDLWKDAKNLFFDANGYALISDAARWYIGGLIKHAAALLAFAAPTTNSYRRLVPGYEAPINLIYSQRNRSAICRIPMYSTSPKAKRLEFRAPDPSANPYLTFAALLMAGLDGIKNKIEPPKPMDVDLYDLEPAERKHVKNTPGTLQESLAALEADHAFLLDGGVNDSCRVRSEEHTSELQSRLHLVCRLLLEKKKKQKTYTLDNKKP